MLLCLHPEDVDGVFPLLAVPAPQLKMVEHPPTPTDGAKSQPLAEQDRSGGRHLWHNAYDLGVPHGQICKQIFGALRMERFVVIKICQKISTRN